MTLKCTYGLNLYKFNFCPNSRITEELNPIRFWILQRMVIPQPFLAIVSSIILKKKKNCFFLLQVNQFQLSASSSMSDAPLLSLSWLFTESVPVSVEHRSPLDTMFLSSEFIEVHLKLSYNYLTQLQKIFRSTAQLRWKMLLSVAFRCHI